MEKAPFKTIIKKTKQNSYLNHLQINTKDMSRGKTRKQVKKKI